MDKGPRVLVLGWSDALGEAAISGMPFHMRTGLERAGCDVVVGRIGSLAAGTGWPPQTDGRIARIGARARRGAVKLSQALRIGSVTRDLEKRAVRAARLADDAVRRWRPDVVFGPCMSTPIGFMQSNVPILYASDATAHLLQSTYGRYAPRDHERIECAHRFETLTLGRADRSAVASHTTARSAVQDHGADPARVVVLPLGANLQPLGEQEIALPAPAPDMTRLDLLLTAADPERKRLSLCADIVTELRRRGWNVRLHYIGPRRPECDRADVIWEGRLRLGDPEDSQRHLRLLRDCHLALLPSVAEMFGIAPIESAAFGRPSVVSDVGGLPTVVEDGRTGRVVPVDTPVAGWADAIEATAGPRTRYEAFSVAAFERQRSLLNWNSWGCSARRLCEEVC